MRLTEQQRKVIRETTVSVFGDTAKVWLFGSRVDDSKKGGDIDLYIEPKVQNPTDVVEAKLRFLMELYKKLGEQKVDVVINCTTLTRELPIHRIAKETGVQLL